MKCNASWYSQLEVAIDTGKSQNAFERPTKQPTWNRAIACSDKPQIVCLECLVEEQVDAAADAVAWRVVVEVVVEEAVDAVVSLTKARQRRYARLAPSCMLPRERW